MNQKYYVVLSNGCIGYVSSICTCSECKQRGEAEWYIYNLNDKYLDCIKHRDLLDKVLNIALSIKDLSHEHGDEYKLKMIADVYMDELLKLTVERSDS